MAIKKKEITVKIDELKTPDFNVRNHPQKQIDEIIRSIKMFGQIRPVVIDEENVIYAGNGTYTAMKQMGAETIEAYRVTGLTDKQKKKLMLADNKTFALGSDNFGNIEALIKELGDFEIPGFDEEVLNNLYGEAEEVANSIGDYGKISDEAVENFNAGVEAKARMEKRFEEERETEQQSPVSYAPPVYNPPVQASENLQKEEVQKFIVCPHCGEKIYF